LMVFEKYFTSNHFHFHFTEKTLFISPSCLREDPPIIFPLARREEMKGGTIRLLFAFPHQVCPFCPLLNPPPQDIRLVGEEIDKYPPYSADVS